jgi:hypothetical protein
MAWQATAYHTKRSKTNFFNKLLAYDFKPFILIETWVEFLFYCISFQTIDFVQFILNVIVYFIVSDNNFFVFQLCYRLW